jgi:hypothetical protein
MAPVPLFIVREDASVDELGVWHHEARTLELVAQGYPFLGVGRHLVEGALPWLFWEMFPSGFLGARFLRAFPELRLTDARWPTDAAECLRGEDLPGNILVGMLDALVGDDDVIDADFRDAWRRHVGV